eukprot:1177219-Prorocentrum_minimum.AAC.4
MSEERGSRGGLEGGKSVESVFAFVARHVLVLDVSRNEGEYAFYDLGLLEKKGTEPITVIVTV